jgi:hypothetical protein
VPIDRSLRRKEIVSQLKTGRRPRGGKADPMLGRNIVKTQRDVGPTGEDHAFNPGADGGKGCSRFVAAVEKRHRVRARHPRARRFDQRHKPPGPGINPGVGGAEQDYRAIDPRCRSQHPDGMRQRVDHDRGLANNREGCVRPVVIRCRGCCIRPDDPAATLVFGNG